jgi:CTP synthase (UTP-ammonia lyase)
MINIALIGDYNPAVTAHQAIPAALERAAGDTNLSLAWTWVGTATLGADVSADLDRFQALWCVPASPYANTVAAIAAIRFARQTGRPFLGTCGGFQHALLEYAEAVWGVASPGHAELDPEATDPVIAPLSCSLVEASGELRFMPGSRLAAIYGTSGATETYHCRYGLNPRFAARLENGPLRVSARDHEGEIRAVELTSHPFFIATLFQPERAGLAGLSHPLISAFAVSAAQAFLVDESKTKVTGLTAEPRAVR